MQTVAIEFRMGSYRYRQIERQGAVALYEQQHTVNPKVIRFEVVRIAVRPAATWPDGRTTPAHEAYPGSYEWRTRGWTFYDLRTAQEHVHTLLQEAETPEERSPYADPDDL